MAKVQTQQEQDEEVGRPHVVGPVETETFARRGDNWTREVQRCLRCDLIILAPPIKKDADPRVTVRLQSPVAVGNTIATAVPCE